MSLDQKITCMHVKVENLREDERKREREGISLKWKITVKRKSMEILKGQRERVKKEEKGMQKQFFTEQS
ncbi:hypothetical protein SESBI_11636 [Sesbania bispinosa]|nr:hypothetical protein SESBI_11636 [Sesbania bispinosa]